MAYWRADISGVCSRRGRSGSVGVHYRFEYISVKFHLQHVRSDVSLTSLTFTLLIGGFVSLNDRCDEDSGH